MISNHALYGSAMGRPQRQHGNRYGLAVSPPPPPPGRQLVGCGRCGNVGGAERCLYFAELQRQQGPPSAPSAHHYRDAPSTDWV